MDSADGQVSPRVLVIPGLDGSTGIMTAAAPRLFPGMRPLFFDHHQDPMDGGVEGLAARALGVLDADGEGSAPAFVCGESFGGTVALTLARRYPQRVMGLILLSTFGCYPSIAARGGQVGLALWRLLGDGVAERVTRLGRPFGVPGALGVPCTREALRTFLEQPALHLPGYRAKCELSLTFDARPWLAEIDVPTFVLTGTWDPVVPIASGRELARQLPRARLYSLPGRHLVHFTRAAEAGGLISRWVDEVVRPADSADGAVSGRVEVAARGEAPDAGFDAGRLRPVSDRVAV